MEVNNFTYKAIRKFDIASVHDISEGGFLVAIAESCFNPLKPMGAIINQEMLGIDNELTMFAETQGCYILSANSSESKKIKSFAKKNNINVRIVGIVGGDTISIKGSFSLKVCSLYNQWRESFPN